jgi:hypothetical protein
MLRKEGRPRVAPQRSPAVTANRFVLYFVLLFFGSLVAYVTYVFGQYNGNYDRLTVSQERAELEVQIARLETANRHLRTQLAELDTIKVGHAREKAEVARMIGDLQNQIARESQELAFYRGMMAKAPNELGVRIGEVRVTRSRRNGAFVVHVSLLRTGRPDNNVSGSLTLHVDSDTGNVLDMPDLTANHAKEVSFNFRYYTPIDQEVTLPEGFKPQHLGVDVRSADKEAPPLTQTFAWSVVP